MSRNSTFGNVLGRWGKSHEPANSRLPDVSSSNNTASRGTRVTLRSSRNGPKKSAAHEERKSYEDSQSSKYNRHKSKSMPSKLVKTGAPSSRALLPLNDTADASEYRSSPGKKPKIRSSSRSRAARTTTDPQTDGGDRDEQPLGSHEMSLNDLEVSERSRSSSVRLKRSSSVDSQMNASQNEKSKSPRSKRRSKSPRTSSRHLVETSPKVSRKKSTPTSSKKTLSLGSERQLISALPPLVRGSSTTGDREKRPLRSDLDKSSSRRMPDDGAQRHEYTRSNSTGSIHPRKVRSKRQDETPDVVAGQPHDVRGRSGRRASLEGSARRSSSAGSTGNAPIRRSRTGKERETLASPSTSRPSHPIDLHTRGRKTLPETSPRTRSNSGGSAGSMRSRDSRGSMRSRDSKASIRSRESRASLRLLRNMSKERASLSPNPAISSLLKRSGSVGSLQKDAVDKDNESSVKFERSSSLGSLEVRKAALRNSHGERVSSDAKVEGTIDGSNHSSSSKKANRKWWLIGRSNGSEQSGSSSPTRKRSPRSPKRSLDINNRGRSPQDDASQGAKKVEAAGLLEYLSRVPLESDSVAKSPLRQKSDPPVLYRQHIATIDSTPGADSSSPGRSKRRGIQEQHSSNKTKDKQTEGSSSGDQELTSEKHLSSPRQRTGQANSSKRKSKSLNERIGMFNNASPGVPVRKLKSPLIPPRKQYSSEDSKSPNTKSGKPKKREATHSSFGALPVSPPLVTKSPAVANSTNSPSSRTASSWKTESGSTTLNDEMDDSKRNSLSALSPKRKSKSLNDRIGLFENTQTSSASLSRKDKSNQSPRTKRPQVRSKSSSPKHASPRDAKASLSSVGDQTLPVSLPLGGEPLQETAETKREDTRDQATHAGQTETSDTPRLRPLWKAKRIISVEAFNKMEEDGISNPAITTHEAKAEHPPAADKDLTDQENFVAETETSDTPKLRPLWKAKRIISVDSFNKKEAAAESVNSIDGKDDAGSEAENVRMQETTVEDDSGGPKQVGGSTLSESRQSKTLNERIKMFNNSLASPTSSIKQPRKVSPQSSSRQQAVQAESKSPTSIVAAPDNSKESLNSGKRDQALPVSLPLETDPADNESSTTSTGSAKDAQNRAVIESGKEAMREPAVTSGLDDSKHSRSATASFRVKSNSLKERTAMFENAIASPNSSTRKLKSPEMSTHKRSISAEAKSYSPEGTSASEPKATIPYMALQADPPEEENLNASIHGGPGASAEAGNVEQPKTSLKNESDRSKDLRGSTHTPSRNRGSKRLSERIQMFNNSHISPTPSTKQLPETPQSSRPQTEEEYSTPKVGSVEMSKANLSSSASDPALRFSLPLETGPARTSGSERRAGNTEGSEMTETTGTDSPKHSRRSALRKSKSLNFDNSQISPTPSKRKLKSPNSSSRKVTIQSESIHTPKDGISFGFNGLPPKPPLGTLPSQTTSPKKKSSSTKGRFSWWDLEKNKNATAAALDQDKTEEEEKKTNEKSRTRKGSSKKGSLGDKISKFNNMGSVPPGLALDGLLSPRTTSRKSKSLGSKTVAPLLSPRATTKRMGPLDAIPSAAKDAKQNKTLIEQNEKEKRNIHAELDHEPKEQLNKTDEASASVLQDIVSSTEEDKSRSLDEKKRIESSSGAAQLGTIGSDIPRINVKSEFPEVDTGDSGSKPPHTEEPGSKSQLPSVGMSIKERLAMFKKASAQPTDLNRPPRPNLLNANQVKKVLGLIDEKINHDHQRTHKASASAPGQNSTQAATETDAEPRKRISIGKTSSFTLANRANVLSELHDKRNRLKASRSRSSGLKEFIPNKGPGSHQAATSQFDEDFSSFTPPKFPKTESEIDLIKMALANSAVFENLEPDDIKRLVAAFQPFKVAHGEIIIKQGDDGDYFYVIASGEVTFHIIKRKVGSAGKGKTFGELALLYTCPRAATVKAASQPTSLFRVDQKTFRYFMRSPTNKPREGSEKLLRGIPFMSQLGDADIERLCSVMTPVLFESGDVIVRKGDDGDYFYIVKEGTVRVTDIFIGNVRYEDATLGPGDYFGERSLMSGERRVADVVGITSGSAFCIDRTTFKKVLSGFEELISRAQDRQDLNGIKIIKELGLSPDDLDSLVRLVTKKEFKSDELVCKEGHTTDAAMYFVRTGVVRLSSHDGYRDEEVGAGGYFGQEHLLADSAGDSGESSCLIEAGYSGVVASESCTIGVLSLEDCRTVFDTKEMKSSGSSSHLLNRRATLRKTIKSSLNLEDLNRDSILGEGQFGEVWLVTAEVEGEESPREFALKIQSKVDEVREDNAIEAIQRELQIIKKLNHPFIIGLVEDYECDEYIYMLMEVVKGGELWSVIHVEDENGDWTSGLSEVNAQFYTFILADTLAYMHRQRIVFRDLKPENVLIDDEGYPILVDFGFAKIISEEMTYTFCGTPNYLAPEIVLNDGHSFGADHWAIGIVTYEMISGENPFYYEGMSQIDLLKAIVRDPVYPLPKGTNLDLVDLVERLLEKEPAQRIGMLAGGEKDILNHKWFEDLDCNKIRTKEATAPWLPSV